ncbi:MAG: sulfite exporter TauE/SafE family protein [Phenylobacterium sp.]|uniref:sulfite exporter TauE/SafE family protein n=1 Tax=Phenylobacterium sp. TaxID=1871053 RepID=UPI002723B149|nr:sulfite exporter TauE/SafE family protein [Phenylobacterium sp.]MDO8910576.1 sulfite exporter TauE/SafE family protein [Phenylobacterium sp.]MDP2010264.1 sulfite exporter TauE/SafE family protein [Phenylobacterium sp.]MDP3102758.1 sulfite exporter TauE/SafE family protein [Phenylobacterium sp.]MDP3635169.1 sulfite exporter TauE/SafE family protein [Phenylobacterium sp.]MDP3868676.1 sulfite exporter TauE/SafE family protein [Phenylobacterium sp.]
MTVYEIVSALMSGLVVGALLGLFGGGGSVLATPLLLYVVGIDDPHVAIGTSAAAVAVNAAISLLGHGRGGRVKWPCATVFAGAGLMGSFLGSSLAKAVDGQRLLLFFAAAMAAIALSMLRRPKSAGDPDVHITLPLIMKLAPLGVLTGVAAGFFGIGGGFLIVPGLMAATGMTLANAAASSLLSVSVFGAATSLNYAVSGQVNWPIALLFILGGLGGGALGVRGAGLLAGHVVLARRLFAGLVLLVAAYVAWRALGA